MKKLILFLAALLSTIPAVNATAFYPSKAVKKVVLLRLTTTDVIVYLEHQGYTVYSIYEIPNTNNYLAYTSKDGIDYETTVYTNGNIVIQTEDTPL